MMKEFMFHFQGTCLVAYLQDGIVDKIFVVGEDYELNHTEDIMQAFSEQYEFQKRIRDN